MSKPQIPLQEEKLKAALNRLQDLISDYLFDPNSLDVFATMCKLEDDLTDALVVSRVNTRLDKMTRKGN